MTERDVIRQVVRGERPWIDLRALGIDIQLEDNRLSIQDPRHLNVMVDVHDLAMGFVAHAQNVRELREWAFVLEAGDFWDLDVERFPASETLMDALWSASFGDLIPEDAMTIVQQLIQENQSHV
jgi:hypothetical protein